MLAQLYDLSKQLALSADELASLYTWLQLISFVKLNYIPSLFYVLSPIEYYELLELPNLNYEQGLNKF